jgi:hypothetical protein
VLPNGRMPLNRSGYGDAMTQEHESLSDKVRDLADRIDEKLEPDEPGPTHQRTDASDPFTNDQRPDEAGFGEGSVAGVEDHPAH